MDRRSCVMQGKVQVVTRRDDGEEALHEVACVERDELTPASLGLSIADSKAILQGIQEVVVAWQMRAYLDSQRHCPQCGKLRHSKGVHHTVFRTVFGDLSIESGCVSLTEVLDLTTPAGRAFVGFLTVCAAFEREVIRVRDV